MSQQHGGELKQEASAEKESFSSFLFMCGYAQKPKVAFAGVTAVPEGVSF
jgi:hypothetical protein